MSGGFNVSVQQLRSHSRTVSGIATDVGTAADAAGSERAGGLVYGVLFDGIALPLLNLWADHLQTSISAAQRTGEGIARSLAANADTYDAAEQDSTTTITASGGQ